jgi:hypothetical protein
MGGAQVACQQRLQAFQASITNTIPPWEVRKWLVRSRAFLDRVRIMKCIIYRHIAIHSPSPRRRVLCKRSKDGGDSREFSKASGKRAMIHDETTRCTTPAPWAAARFVSVAIHDEIKSGMSTTSI